MDTTLNQRWRDRRGTYRPAGEVIDPRHYEIHETPSDTLARSFVEQHHYSASYPSARFRICLHRQDALVGVAVFSFPMQTAVFKPLPGDKLQSVELGRLVLLDDVPGNAETWFLGRCFEILRAHEITGVVSYSDPLPRAQIDGTITHGGHVGTIYQAHNAHYLGRGKKRTLALLPDGRVFSERNISKIKKGHKGWRYASDLLVQLGADRLTDASKGAAWLAHWLPLLTRPVRHPGNHKYIWGLDKPTKKHMVRWMDTHFGDKKPVYPKMIDLV